MDERRHRKPPAEQGGVGVCGCLLWGGGKAGGGRCRISWTIAMAPKRITKARMPKNGAYWPTVAKILWPGAAAPVGAVAAYSPKPGALTLAYGSPPGARRVGRARQLAPSLYWISLNAPGGKRSVRW